MDTRCFIIYMPVMMIISASSASDVPDKIWPAEIFGISTVKAHENVLLKCIAVDRRVSSDKIHMYLIKNGAAVMMELLDKKDEHTFILKNISVWDSGNYSCVYSKTKYTTKDVTASGKNSIYVQVTDVVPKRLVENWVVPLVVLPLVGIPLFVLFHMRRRICKKFFQNQRQSVQNNTGHHEEQRSEEGMHTMISYCREDPFDNTYEYSTIQDSQANTRTVSICYAEPAVYSLVEDHAAYSVAKYTDKKTETTQPTAATDIYGKVQKRKK